MDTLKKDGSSIIIVLLLTVALVSLATTIVRSATSMLGIAAQRTLYERRYFATHGLLNYGEAVVRRYHKTLSTMPAGREQITIDVGRWPLAIDSREDQSSISYRGAIIILIEPKAIILEAQLMQNNQSEPCHLLRRVIGKK